MESSVAQILPIQAIPYQPKFGRVLIRRDVSEKTKGGIIIPNAKRHANCEGVILALGETAGWTRSYDEQGNEEFIQALKVGQTVIFGKHSGAWLDGTHKSEDNEDGTLFICQDEDILCTKE